MEENPIVSTTAQGEIEHESIPNVVVYSKYEEESSNTLNESDLEDRSRTSW